MLLKLHVKEKAEKYIVPTCSLPPQETGWVGAPTKPFPGEEATPEPCSVSGGSIVPALLKTHAGARAQRRYSAEPKDA